MGQKTDDYRTIPLCRACHRARDVSGAGGWSPEEVENVQRIQLDLLVCWAACRTEAERQEAVPW